MDVRIAKGPKHLTGEHEADTGQECQLGFAAVSPADLGAFHADQREDGSEEAEANGGDHKSSAHLDVSC